MNISPVEYRQQIADGATFSLSAGSFGWLFAQIGDDEAFALGCFDSTGTYTHFGDHGAVALVDVAASFCIFTSGGVLVFKNNLGGPKALRIEVYFGDVTDPLADGATRSLGSDITLGAAMLGDDDAFSLFWTATAGAIGAVAGHDDALVDIANKLCLLTAAGAATVKNRLGAVEPLNYLFPDGNSESASIADSGSTTRPITSAGWAWVIAPDVPAFALVSFNAAGSIRNLIFSAGPIDIVTGPGDVAILGAANEIEIENRTGGLETIWFALSMAPDIADVAIDHFSARVAGIHVKAGIDITGEGFEAGLGFTVDGVAGTATVNSATSASLVLPKFTQPGSRDLVFFFDDPLLGTLTEENAIKWTDGGYRIMRGLLPPNRYTTDVENLFNIVLAVVGQFLDRQYWAGRDLVGIEIFPETTEALISRHEDHYGVSPQPGDTLANRRARVVAAMIATASIALPGLNAIVNQYLPGVTITEKSGFAEIGQLVWLALVYEPAPNTLTENDRAALLALLHSHGPGWVGFGVGHNGFIVSASKVSRDFVAAE